MLRIGWLIQGLGVYGSVREMVEISNALVRRGHEVTLYTLTGGKCMWLPSLSGAAPASRIEVDGLDVLIGMMHWNPELRAIFENSNVPVKAVCIMGFAPSDALVDKLTGRVPGAGVPAVLREAVSGRYAVMTDSTWQRDWLREHVGIETLPPFGGINTNMFRPVRVEHSYPLRRIIASGDPRTRKGLGMVRAAVNRLGKDARLSTYWGMGIPQSQMCRFLSSGEVFLDGQQRGGWSNPVAEAMACGHAAVVCTDIAAGSDFAIHGETALLVPYGDSAAMADATTRLLDDEGLRLRLVRAAYDAIQRFSYDAIAPALEAALEAALEKLL